MVIATTTIATIIPTSVVVDMRKCYVKRWQNKSLSIRRSDCAAAHQNLDYSYVQVAYTILDDSKTMEREYCSLLSINDNYPKYLLTTDFLLQKKDGIKHENLMEFMREGRLF